MYDGVGCRKQGSHFALVDWDHLLRELFFQILTVVSEIMRDVNTNDFVVAHLNNYRKASSIKKLCTCLVVFFPRLLVLRIHSN